MTADLDSGVFEVPVPWWSSTGRGMCIDGEVEVSTSRSTDRHRNLCPLLEHLAYLIISLSLSLVI